MASVRWQTSLSFFVLLVTSWSAFLNHVPNAGAQAIGGSYRRPLAQNPVTLDPHQHNDIYGRTIAQQLYDGLVQYDDSLSVKPAIATSWRASRDGLTWTFFLRKGVKFHHGREVTAEDFVYSFTRILNPATKSAGAPLLAVIKGAKDYMAGKSPGVQGLHAVDKYTLRVTLEESTIPFVAIAAVGFAKVVPREIVKQRGQDFGRMPVGTGPFKFRQWIPHKRVILDANSDYFEGKPYLDKLEYHIFSGNVIEQMFAEFEAGNLEDSPIPSKQRKAVLSSKKYQLIRRPILGISFIAFNTIKKPFDNPLIRQAITHAIDRKGMMEEINNGRFLPGKGILPPGTYAYDPVLPGLPYDPTKAKALLAAAGYPHGQGLPPIVIWSARSFEAAKAEHDAIQKYLAEVGIKVEFRYNRNWQDFKSKVYAGTFQAFRYSWYADTPYADLFLRSLFHSSSFDNITHYSNERVNVLIDKAGGVNVFTRRVQLYQEAEQQIVEEAPILVLYYYNYERVFQSYVKGVNINALGDPYIPMKKIWITKKRSVTGRSQ